MSEAEEKKDDIVAEAPKKGPREVVIDQDQSYWAIVGRQFRKNKLAVWSLRIVYVIIVIGLLADFLANDKPIYCKIDGKSYFPVFKEYMVWMGLGKWPPELTLADWKTDFDYESVIWPLVPYGQAETDDYNPHFVGPFEEQRKIESWRFWHFMGTDEIGHDVLSGMIHGTRIAMQVGIIAMGIAFFIGIIVGSLAGYFGDTRLKMSRAAILMNLIGFPLAFFYMLKLPAFIGGGLLFQIIVGLISFLVIVVLANLLGMAMQKLPVFNKRINIPLDILISRFIEIFVSIPRLLLILSVIAILDSSIFIVMVVIGFTTWTGIARFIRGELLRVRSLEYIEAANALGYNEFRIILKHALPNSLTSALIAVAFGVASAILIESSLSFLGIGVQAEVMTWGKLLNFARKAPEAWWLAIFPGFAIFITVTVFNLLGDGLQDAMDPRRKQ